eukprot:COSAG03_NODE_2103_length_3122_cov_26.351968_2_plen_113_part_00
MCEGVRRYERREGKVVEVYYLPYTPSALLTRHPALLESLPSVPFRSRPFQCARIGFGGKEAALGPGSSTNRRAIGFRVDCGTDRQSPAGRAAGSSKGRGLARSLVSTLSTHE